MQKGMDLGPEEDDEGRFITLEFQTHYLVNVYVSPVPSQSRFWTASYEEHEINRISASALDLFENLAQ